MSFYIKINLQVEDDVVSCTTVNEEKCEDETSGYTTSTKCSKWPKEVCTVEKKTVKKERSDEEDDAPKGSDSESEDFVIKSPSDLLGQQKYEK